jgi:hypothetical protein
MGRLAVRARNVPGRHDELQVFRIFWEAAELLIVGDKSGWMGKAGRSRDRTCSCVR